MKEIFGIAFSLGGAIIFFSLSLYIIFRKNKDYSHYFFSLFAFFAGLSEILAFFEFTNSKEIAYTLLKFDLSSLAVGAYFYLLFSYYFRNGFNKKFALISIIPTVIVIFIVFLLMIKGMVMGPYGWAGVYYIQYHLIYGIYGISYITTGHLILGWVYRELREDYLKKKILLLVSGSGITVLGSIINIVVIILIGRIFPIIETSLMLTAFIFAIAISK